MISSVCYIYITPLYGTQVLNSYLIPNRSVPHTSESTESWLILTCVCGCMDVVRLASRAPGIYGLHQQTTMAVSSNSCMAYWPARPPTNISYVRVLDFGIEYFLATSKIIENQLKFRRNFLEITASQCVFSEFLILNNIFNTIYDYIIYIYIIE